MTTLEKFRNYIKDVEGEVESLIYSMLDIIEAKTQTLRKLMKLNLQLKKISSVNFYNKELNFPSYTISRSDARTILTKTTTSEVLTPIHNSLPNCKANVRYKRKGVQYTETDTEKKEDKMTTVSDIATICAPSYVDSSFDNYSSESLDSILPPKQLDDFNYTKDDKYNDTNKNLSLYSNTPSAKSVLETALHTLQKCQNGDGSVYMDATAYNDVIDSLKIVLNSRKMYSINIPSNQRTNKHATEKSCPIPVIRSFLNPDLKNPTKRSNYSAPQCIPTTR